MGTPWRSKKFHEAYFGNMGDNTLPDQVDRHEAAGARGTHGSTSTAPESTATRAAAMRRRARCSAIPDFFKVGISEAGNHDNRVYEDDWAEKWQGLLEKNAGRHDQLRQPGEPEYWRRT